MKTSKDLSLLEKTKLALQKAQEFQDIEKQIECYLGILNDEIIVIIYE